MKIAVIGGGPGGSRVSELLARKGHQVVLFDAQGPWEKPCGGGVTAKTRSLEDILPAGVPRQPIDRVTIFFADGVPTVVPVGSVVVVSRKDLAVHCHEAARRAGAEILTERVVTLTRRADGWSLRTNARSMDADFVVGADGATSFVRRSLGMGFTASDLHVTAGYFIPGRADSRMKIFFLPELEGYVWSFPRPDHLSYGLITRAEPNWATRSKAILSNYIRADLGEQALEQGVFYSAPVPSLSREAWARNRLHGEGWALIGDAAGLVDPITGEGIYYALRSAEILAASFPDLPTYTNRMNAECVVQLKRSAALYSRFYRGSFLGGSFRKRTLQLARRSASVRSILQALITGTEPYVGLRRHLLRSLPKILIELALSAPQPEES